jgi:beta-galactosidase
MRYPPIIPGLPTFIHGGDYNPDQWLDRPDAIEADFRLAREARMNSFSIGIFAWATLEPEEGCFEFGWLDDIMDRMAAAGMKAVLATPSGAKPNWMAAKYPEIRRVQPMGNREHQAGRHNHCYTSTVYREKVAIINTKLAERYRQHPALGIWHVSNEYGGECHCDLCKRAFRLWLERKHGTLDRLNRAWWTAFWSHTYTTWEQIDWIDGSVHGLVLDWKRFVSDQTADFMNCEIAPLKRQTPDVPVTTNLMGTYPGVDYRRLAPHLDVISWDAYPAYHAREDMAEVGSHYSFLHDLNRGLKGGRPFLLMESSPSAVNWMRHNKLLRPGILKLKSLQAIAHGADSVQYFQFRKGRGGCEKFHGAVVDHVGHGKTRVFGEVTEVGAALEKLAGIVGCSVPAEVALIYDWDVRWILDDAVGPIKGMYEECVLEHYRAFWRYGVPVDVRGSTDDLVGYKMIVAPMLYLIKPGVAERLAEFVRTGGTVVGTFLTGIADENDLVFEGGWPGPLRKLFGIWAEETDFLYEDETNRLVPGDYAVRKVCDLIHAEGAEIVATYGDDFYAGRPAVTRNRFGAGHAWYLAANGDRRFLVDFYRQRVRELGLHRAVDDELPEGVTAQVRTDGQNRFVFLLNFTGARQQVGKHVLDPYGVRVLSDSSIPTGPHPDVQS